MNNDYRLLVSPTPAMSGMSGMSAMAGGPAFNPLTDLNLICYYDPATAVYQYPGVNFTGVAGCRMTSTSSQFNTGPGVDFTWAGWIYFESAATNYTFAAKGAAVGGYEWYGSIFSGVPRFTGWNNAGSSSASAVWGSTLSIRTWYFVALVRDSSGSGTLKISVNNGAFVSQTTLKPDSVGGGFALGGDFDGGAYNGRVAPCGFWTRQLTQGASSDLSALYNAGAPLLKSELPAGLLTNLVAYFDFNSNSNITADQSGNGNNLTNVSSLVVLAQGVAPHSVVSGQYASGWNDQSINGRNLTAYEKRAALAATAGVSLYTSSLVNSKPGFTGNGSTTYWVSDAVGAAIAGVNTPYGFFTVIDGMDTTVDNCIFLSLDIPPAGDANENFDQLYWDHTGGDRWGFQRCNSTGSTLTIVGGTCDSGRHSLALVFDGTTFTIYFDGVSVASNTKLNNNPNHCTTMTFWAHRNNTIMPDHYKGNYALKFMTSGTLTGTQLNNIFNYFRSVYSTP